MLLLFWCCYFSDKTTTHFACLHRFQLFLKFLCVSPTSFSYFFLLWSQFDVYWYILEAGVFCPFMLIFIVVGGGGKCPVGSYTRIPGAGGGQGGPFSLLPPLFSFFTPLFSLFPPLVFFLPPLLFSFLPPHLSFLPSFLSFLPPPLSFLPPPSPLLPQPCPPLHSVTGLVAQKPLPPGTIRTNGKKVE